MNQSYHNVGKNPNMEERVSKETETLENNQIEVLEKRKWSTNKTQKASPVDITTQKKEL